MMEMVILRMQINEYLAPFYRFVIIREQSQAHLLFDPDEKILRFESNNDLTKWLKGHERQLRAMLHNKRRDTFYPGFRLTFAMRNQKDVAAYNDRSKIVVLDKREEPHKNYVLDGSEERLDKLFTDASFLEDKGMGGIAVIHQDLDGEYHLYHETIKQEGSCQLELLAAVRGLEILHNVDKVRIITDSQYVRKGLTEWIVNWELNEWMTVNGEKVKNIDVWQKFNELSKGKYIEFEWVKGHTNHFENTLCDLYAKSASRHSFFYKEWVKM